MDLQVLSGTCEDIKSYKGERAVVVHAVVANEFAKHEAQIGFEDEMLRSLVDWSMRARAADRSPANEPVEIRDDRWLNSGRGQKKVEQRS